jgi:hypothetical protein
VVHVAARVALAGRQTAGVNRVQKNGGAAKSAVGDDAALRIVLMKLYRRWDRVKGLGGCFQQRGALN